MQLVSLLFRATKRDSRRLVKTMSKTLCDWSKKDIERHAAELLDIVTPQHFMCFKCARTACDKHYLCRPEAMERIRRKSGAVEDKVED